MATKIKTDLKEEYQGIKYILTSTMRTKLLLSIYNDPKNLDELRVELKKNINNNITWFKRIKKHKLC